MGDTFTKGREFPKKKKKSNSSTIYSMSQKQRHVMIDSKGPHDWEHDTAQIVVLNYIIRLYLFLAFRGRGLNFVSDFTIVDEQQVELDELDSQIFVPHIRSDH